MDIIILYTSVMWNIQMFRHGIAAALHVVSPSLSVQTQARTLAGVR